MSESDKKIHDWQNKVHATFGEASKLYEYVFSTMENFFYRYLETSETKNLKISELAENTFGAFSFESDMVAALKVQNKEIKYGIMELAKRIPKAEKPMVRYGLFIKINELSSDKGNLVISSEINWDFPEFGQKNYQQKKVIFDYNDLNQFRKELALKLEEACELFS